MSVFGALQFHADGEPAGASPWDAGPPPDVVCSLCQHDITPEEFGEGNVEWPPCGHFGHRECPAGGMGLDYMQKCPNCQRQLQRPAKAQPTQHAEAAAATEAAEEQRAEEVVGRDVLRARSDAQFWRDMPRAYRADMFHHVARHNLPALPYGYEDAASDEEDDDDDEDDDDYEEVDDADDDVQKYIVQKYVVHKDTAVVREKLEHGCPVDTRNGFGATLLMVACTTGDPDKIWRIIKAASRAEDSSDMMVDLMSTVEQPMLGSASPASLEVIRTLLQRGAQVNARDDNGMTALMYATHGPVSVAELLIEARADVHPKDSSDMNALMHAIIAGNTDMARYLARHGARTDVQPAVWDLSIMEACKEEQIDTLLLVVEFGANVDAQDEAGVTPLMATIAEGGGNMRIIRCLLDNGAAVDTQDADGRSALMYACKAGRLDIVRALVEAHADVNAHDAHRATALMRAVLIYAPDIVRCLLDNGARVDARDDRGNTALMLANERGITTIARMLEGVNITSRTSV